VRAPAAAPAPELTVLEELERLTERLSKGHAGDDDTRGKITRQLQSLMSTWNRHQAAQAQTFESPTNRDELLRMIDRRLGRESGASGS